MEPSPDSPVPWWRKAVGGLLLALGTCLSVWGAVEAIRWGATSRWHGIPCVRPRDIGVAAGMVGLYLLIRGAALGGWLAAQAKAPTERTIPPPPR